MSWRFRLELPHLAVFLSRQKARREEWASEADESHVPERGHFRVNPACPPAPRRAEPCTRGIAPSFESQDQPLKGPASRPAIRTFDVNSVTYADGSTWHASSPSACSVAPR